MDLFGRMTYFEVDMHSMNNVTVEIFQTGDSKENSESCMYLYKINYI